LIDLNLPAGVRIWVVDCRPDPDPYCLLLSPEERAQADALSDARVRGRFVHCRGVARRELGAQLGIPPAEVPIGLGPHGKPLLLNLDGPRASSDAQIDFSISHGGDWGLVALSQVGPVGVDLEAQRPVARSLALAKRFFPWPLAGEIEASLNGQERERLFLYHWTRLEAQAKAQGIGILRFLAQITNAETGPAGQGLAPVRVLESFEPVEGYQAALCLLAVDPPAAT
jgi:4'-phosphopantetheinyl transferase